MRAYFLAAVAVCSAATTHAQIGRLTDWWTYAGDAQRTGWEKNEQRFVRDDVKKFQLLWKMKLEGAGEGPRQLAPPLVLGTLIGSRGFKELAFVQGGTGELWSVDADLARLYWNKPVHVGTKANCAAVAATPSLPPPVVFRFNAPRAPAPAGTPGTSAAPAPIYRPPAATPSATPAPAPATPPPTETPSAGTPATSPAAKPPTAPVAPSGAPSGQGIPGGGPGAPPSGPPAGAMPAQRPAPPLPAMFRVRPVYVLSPDGKLRQVNVDDASELKPALEFLPEGFQAGSLNMAGTTIYATGQNCDSGSDSVFSLDVGAAESKPMEFKAGASLANTGGAVLSTTTSGVVYAQTGDGKANADAKSHGNSLLALDGKDLSVKDYITLPAGNAKTETGMNVTTPVAFSFKGREMVVTTGKDGRLYLLAGDALGGSDHKTPLAKTAPLVKPDGKSATKGVWGRLASWEAPGGTRFVIATVLGPLAPGMPARVGGAKRGDGALVAFKIAEENGSAKLLPAWTSVNLAMPSAPVIAQGVVFVLENGKYKRKLKGNKIEEAAAKSTHATLHALDGMTGEEMWSTGDQVKAAGSLTGLSIANSRVYFTTVDGTLFAFGKHLETN